MSRVAWPSRARRRKEGPTSSRSLLGAALVAAGLLSGAKLALIVQELGWPNPILEIPARAGGEGETRDETEEELPAPAAGPNQPEAGRLDEMLRAPADAASPGTHEVAILNATEREILEMLGTRRAALDQRARELELRAAVLESAEARLAEQLEQLSRLYTALAGIVAEHDAAEAEKLKSLVKIYETMKPRSAAEIFDRLDMSVLVRVVSSMSAAKSSAVIARMDSRRAEQLTARLAKRSELPGLAP